MPMLLLGFTQELQKEVSSKKDLLGLQVRNNRTRFSRNSELKILAETGIFRICNKDIYAYTTPSYHSTSIRIKSKTLTTSDVVEMWSYRNYCSFLARMKNSAVTLDDNLKISYKLIQSYHVIHRVLSHVCTQEKETKTYI